MAEIARTEPTARSMPPVRMTKVMPAASTMLTEACWATIAMLVAVRNLPVARWKPIAIRISTGSIPIAWMMLRICTARADRPWPPDGIAAGGAGAVSVVVILPSLRSP